LTPPEAIEPIPPLLDQLVFSTGELFSPSGWILKAIELIPKAKEAITRAEYDLVGDWNSVLLASDALKKLDDFSTELAAELHVANTNWLGKWQGNAADAAYDFFERQRKALDKHADALGSAAGDLQGVAIGMESGAKTLVGGFEMLLDWVIYIAATAAISAAASTTGVGTVAWVSVALGVLGATNEVGKLLKAMNWMEESIRGLTALVATYLSAFNAQVDLELPRR